MSARILATMSKFSQFGRAALFTGTFVLALPAMAAPRSEGGSHAPKVPLDNARQYNACMQLANSQPRDAYASANAWLQKGGGVGAEHCAAVALFNLGEYVEAAGRLERLAQSAAVERPDLRAGLYAQAGDAWSMAEKPDRALAAQDNAVRLAPDNVDYLIDRAVTKANANQLRDAVADLSRALQIDPRKYEALTLRATAYRLLGDAGKASADIEQAIRVNPDYPEAMLERGLQRAAQGQVASARLDFASVLRMVSSSSDLAAQARAQMDKLDAKAR